MNNLSCITLIAHITLNVKLARRCNASIFLKGVRVGPIGGLA